MKQVPKTQQVLDRMRAAFGPDVDVQKLPVYEATLINTAPLRKSGGIFKGARPTMATLTQTANAINGESAPLQLQHDTDTEPFGRAFYAEVQGDEVRGLFTVTDPAKQASIDNGTIDQVSVNFMPAHITCSACGFDYLGDTSTAENLIGLVCEEGHALNQNGVFAYVDGVASFHELSLVGKGAATGARIVGPSESRLAAGNDNYRRLAAKAGFSGISLTCEAIEDNQVDLTAQYTAAVEAKATAEAKLATTNDKVTALEASVADLTTKLAAATDADVAAKLTAAEATVTAAVAVLTEEAKAILTALQKPVENLPTTVAELTAVIKDHRAEFAALIPTAPRSKPAGSETGEDNNPAPASSAAFSTRR